MTEVTLPLVDISKNADGTVTLSLNMKGLKLLASLTIEEEVSRFELRLRRGEDFDFNWPKETERYTDVREGTIETPFGSRAIRIGHVQRLTGGKMRDVVTVFVDYRPIVQFLASDDGRKMASVIREPNSKRHIFDAGELPTAYQQATQMTIESYRLYVESEKSTTGLAVICDPDDHATMVRHALMRLGVDVRQRRSSIELIRQKPRPRRAGTKRK